MIAKAKLAGMWREKVEQSNSGPVIVEVNRPKAVNREHAHALGTTLPKRCGPHLNGIVAGHRS